MSPPRIWTISGRWLARCRSTRDWRRLPGRRSEGECMPKFAANLTMLFGDLPFLERFDAAARNGFRAVEYMFPYQEDTDGIARALEGLKLEQVLFNLPAGDWAAGDRGVAGDPGPGGAVRPGGGGAAGPALRVPCPWVDSRG